MTPPSNEIISDSSETDVLKFKTFEELKNALWDKVWIDDLKNTFDFSENNTIKITQEKLNELKLWNLEAIQSFLEKEK